MHDNINKISITDLDVIRRRIKIENQRLTEAQRLLRVNYEKEIQQNDDNLKAVENALSLKIAAIGIDIKSTEIT